VTSSKKRTLDFAALAGKQMSRDVAAATAGPDRFERAKAALAGPPTLLELDDIKPRQDSTREIEPEHVRALAESIAALGLIEPIVVDVAQRLLAGGHRVEALKFLRDQQPDAYARWFASGVPVLSKDFDAEVNPSRALEIEIAENEHRRDYTGSQVKELATRLRAAGYRDTVGRPKVGEKALGPALEVIVGKSMKTIRKLLVDEQAPSKLEPARKEELPLAKVRRVLEKQRPLIPDGLLMHLDALLEGLAAVDTEQQGA
jgi:ParB family chromosome partitioning protein